MVDRLLSGLPAQQKGTTARWYSNKTSLIQCTIREGGRKQNHVLFLFFATSHFPKISLESLVQSRCHNYNLYSLMRSLIMIRNEREFSESLHCFTCDIGNPIPPIISHLVG